MPVDGAEPVPDPLLFARGENPHHEEPARHRPRPTPKVVWAVRLECRYGEPVYEAFELYADFARHHEHDVLPGHVRRLAGVLEDAEVATTVPVREAVEEGVERPHRARRTVRWRNASIFTGSG